MMKSILITGAGSGIGRASAIALSKNAEIRLILVGRRVEALEETLAELENREQHVLLDVDITHKEAFAKSLRKALEPGSSLHGVFANAGIGGENTYGEGDRWDLILNTNLNGTYYTIMECLPYLRGTSGYKNILITSSCLARFGVPNYTAYCTSKAGLLGLTRALAVELAHEQILVNALAPGWVDTEMARAGIQLLADRSGATFDACLEQQMSYVPTGKMSTPDEVGRLVTFLLTNQETSFTGNTFDINNGSFMN
ncbi:MAG: SDR family oxidoreductase [Flavobacteriales bacterium]|nr:SDR family oxidoreductase [Flavobacteriales bacterium]